MRQLPYQKQLEINLQGNTAHTIIKAIELGQQKNKSVELNLKLGSILCLTQSIPLQLSS